MPLPYQLVRKVILSVDILAEDHGNCNCLSLSAAETHESLFDEEGRESKPRMSFR